MLLVDLVAEQTELAKKIVLKDRLPRKIKTVAAVDQSFPDEKTVVSAVVVCNYKTFDVVERAHSIVRTNFPYISGFLSYREGPAIIEAVSALKTKPDVLLVDGNGILHFRKAGLASYVGVQLDIPTIGVAKSLLCGYIVKMDKDLSEVIYKDELRGYIFEPSRKVIVSPGHLVSLKTSLNVVQHCLKEYSFPEPLRMAHQHANKIKLDYMKSIFSGKPKKK